MIDRITAGAVKLIKLIVIAFFVVALFRWASDNPEQFGTVVAKLGNAAAQSVGAAADWVTAQTGP